MRRYLALLLAVSVFVALGPRARAEAIAVVDEVYDEVPPELTQRFSKTVEDSLKSAGFGVTGRDRVRERLLGSHAALGCGFGPCLVIVGKTLGVELALSVRVTMSGQSFTFTLTMSDMHSGLPLAQLTDGCQVCTADEAESALTLAMVDLTLRYHNARDTSAKPPPPPPRVRTTTWILTGAALVLVSTGVALVAAGKDSAGWAALGGGGGLVVGAVMSY
jgi:hypothetical protein